MEHQFKIGDRVRVMGSRPADWREPPVWAASMDGYAGKEGVVYLIGICVGVRFENGKCWNYKPSWLIPIPAKEEALLKVGDRVRVVGNDPFFCKGAEGVVDTVDPRDSICTYRVNGRWVDNSSIEPIHTETPSRPSVVSAAKHFLGIDRSKESTTKLPLINKTKLLTTIKLD